MKVIITGATGFVGRNLAERFHDDGLKVVATGRSRAVGDELRKKGIEFQGADLLDLDQLNRVFSPADCLIHCAARSGPWGRYAEFYEANVVGTRNIIALCKRFGIKNIIFTSTPSVYFTNKDRYDVSESDPLPEKQTSHYAGTKLVAETELMALQQEGHKVIAFRPRALYGPYDNTIIPRILRLADRKRMPIVKNGLAMVDVTYVDNLTDAVRASLAAPDDAWNEVYNISNGDPISVYDWFSQVLSIFDRPFRPKNIPAPVAMTLAGIMEFVGHLPFVGKEPPMTRYSVGYMAKSMTMAIDKARQKLNYSPRVGNQQGFEKYAEWYCSK
ncbi:MAG: NAD(P)-dependent oxidoreductase [bacterium]|nr:NAD(P)-dependent oxidoreductase [bacterium]